MIPLRKLKKGFPFEVERGRKRVELAPEECPKHLEPGEYKKALEGKLEP